MARILVVDDEVRIADLLHDLLIKAGHDVLTVYTAENALKNFKEKKFDFVITDIEMPKMTGQELLKAIRTENRNIPVIAITGRFDSEFINELAIDFTKVLIKPIDITILPRVIASVL